MTGIDFAIKKKGAELQLPSKRRGLTRGHLQGSKIATTPSLTEIIAEKERRVGQLRCELHFERESRVLGETLAGGLLLLVGKCNKAMDIYKQGQENIRAEYEQF